MASLACLTVIKKFTYRDAPEEYSNEYFLTGSIPADAAAWRTLFDALVTQEKTLYPSTVTVVRGYGHDSDDPHAAAVWSVDLTVSPNTPVAGTLALGRGIQMPGDDAVWARWKTSRLNSKGKAIYLRKYFHPAVSAGTTNKDAVLQAQVDALNAFGAKLSDGSFTDARTIRSRAHSETITGHGSSIYITTRTLKRRGKRP